MPATGPNQVRAYAFVFDACFKGGQLKRRMLIDQYAIERLALDIAGGIRSSPAIATLRR